MISGYQLKYSHMTGCLMDVIGYRSHDQQSHFWSLDILLIMTDTETVWILMVGEYRNCRTVI